MSTLHEAISVAGGSIPGRHHVAAGRNNQDAFAWRREGQSVVAVVTDGCSAGCTSELGARVGAELFAERWAFALRSGSEPNDPAVWQSIEEEALAELSRLIRTLGGEPAVRVQDSLLFTIVGAVITPVEAWLFSAGDGVVVIDGEVRTLGPFANNAPPYLGYRLLGGNTRLTVERIEFRHFLALATDGAMEVPQLAALVAEDGLFRNPDLLRRRLAVLARSGVVLHDDTTVIALRRTMEGA